MRVPVLLALASPILLAASGGFAAAGGDSHPGNGHGHGPGNGPHRMSCGDLVNLRLSHTKVVSAVEVPAGPFSSVPGTGTLTPTCSSDITSPNLPAFCRVIAQTSEPNAVDPIVTELWLPLSTWNGKFQGIGNHGFGGEFEYSDMGPEIVKGYAVATTDTGHPGTGTAWMQNWQQIINYGYLGIHEMTVQSKEIIKAFYGKKPKYSYFNGCSTGGKEGMMAAQRYPDDYDGINVAGSANFAQIHNRIQYVWDGQSTFGNAGTPLTIAKLTLVNKAAIAACDAKDGVIDGVIDDPLTCDFHPSSIQCMIGQDPSTCLTANEVAAVENVYAGPRANGKEIYPGYARGTELGWSGGSATTGPGVGTADTFFKFMVYNDPNWDFKTFKFNQDTLPTDLRFSAVLDAIDPDLRRFQKKRGKILFSHAWGASTHTATRSLEYFEQVVSVMNGGKSNLSVRDFDETREFFRFFLAPGGTGSKGPASYDSMPYLERWVEDGIAPDSIIAHHSTSGVVDRTRPLCAYPETAVYKGNGSIDDASNFRCQRPLFVTNYFKKNGPPFYNPF